MAGRAMWPRGVAGWWRDITRDCGSYVYSSVWQCRVACAIMGAASGDAMMAGPREARQEERAAGRARWCTDPIEQAAYSSACSAGSVLNRKTGLVLSRPRQRHRHLGAMPAPGNTSYTVSYTVS